MYCREAEALVNASCKEKQDRVLSVLCYGDSNTWGYDPRNYLPEQYACIWTNLLSEKTQWKIDNQGENGREIPVTPVCFPEDTDLIIIMLGTNDLLSFKTAEEVSRKMESFVKSLDLEKKKLLLIASPVLSSGEWVWDQNVIRHSANLSKQYLQVAQRQGIRFVDSGLWGIPMAFDGVHFTEEGHRIFAERLYEYLIKEIKNDEYWREST